MTQSAPLLLNLPDVLLGDRVLIRPWADSDAGPLLEAVNESRERLTPWMLWAAEHRSLDDSRIFIRRAQAQWLLREELQMGICERLTGRLLGGTGLHRIHWEGRRFEIGYWLRTSAEGHGYMREGVKLLTMLAFETLQAQRVQIRMDPRNARSQSVAARLGYVFEGTLRRVSLDGDGVSRDRHIYALTPDDYARLNWPFMAQPRVSDG
jgi:RimJ/RimL family protein N-acetyltransferase